MNVIAGRLARERKTLDAMIAIYCRDVHAASRGLCAACGGLQKYAHDRLIHCPFGLDKPTCLRCTVHCYHGEMRERVRAVMRDAGPRMLLRRPILTLLHLYWDSRREARRKPARGRAA